MRQPGICASLFTRNEHLQPAGSPSPGVRRDPIRRELPWPETTRAAEGLPRRPWTRGEIEAIVAAGIVDEDERFELIGGEVVPMSPKGARHELVKMEVNRHLVLTLPDDLAVIPETTPWLDNSTFVGPDFCIFPRTIAPGDQRGPNVLLAIEIADASLQYDLGRKIGVFAAYGIAEVWVIDARRLVTHVHRALGAEGYRQISEYAGDRALQSWRRSEIRLTLAALGLAPAGED